MLTCEIIETDAIERSLDFLASVDASADAELMIRALPHELSFCIYVNTKTSAAWATFNACSSFKKYSLDVPELYIIVLLQDMKNYFITGSSYPKSCVTLNIDRVLRIERIFPDGIINRCIVPRVQSIRSCNISPLIETPLVVIELDSWLFSDSLRSLSRFERKRGDPSAKICLTISETDFRMSSTNGASSSKITVYPLRGKFDVMYFEEKVSIRLPVKIALSIANSLVQVHNIIRLEFFNGYLQIVGTVRNCDNVRLIHLITAAYSVNSVESQIERDI